MKLLNTIVIIIFAIIAIIIGLPFLGNLFQSTRRMAGDVGSVPGRAIESGIVRRDCEKFKNQLDAKFESAKNTYTQSVVLKVQELSANAKLANQEVTEVNKVALESIFGKTNPDGTVTPPAGEPSQQIITAMAKYSQDFAKPDPQLRRGVAEAISSGRSRFEADMKEVIDIKTQFKNYAEDNSVYLPGGTTAIKVLEFNQCIPDLNGDGKSDPELFFNKYNAPTTKQTDETFNGGFDKPVL